MESLKPSDRQLRSIRDFISKEKLNSEIVNEMQRIEEEEERKVDRSKLVYKVSNETYDFRSDMSDMSTANGEQDQLLRYINKLKS